MQKRMTNRTNVGVMMAGQGATGDVFAATEQFQKVHCVILCVFLPLCMCMRV